MHDFLHFTVFVTVSLHQQLSHGRVNIVLYIYHVQIHPAEMCHRIYVTAAYITTQKRQYQKRQCILLKPDCQITTYKNFTLHT